DQIQMRECSRRFPGSSNADGHDSIRLRCPKEAQCAGCVNAARVVKLEKPKRPRVMVNSTVKAKRVNHPGRSLRRKREAMLRVPVGRQRQNLFRGHGWKTRLGHHHVKEIKIDVASVTRNLEIHI